MEISYNILQTEVGIRTAFKGTSIEWHTGEVTKLAGQVGEKYVWLYYPIGPEHGKLGITLEYSRSAFTIWLTSNIPDFRLLKGESAILQFEDGSKIELTFLQGKTDWFNGFKMNLCLLSELHIVNLAQQGLRGIRLINRKGEFKDCIFYTGPFNRQYQSEEDGRNLLCTVAHLIGGMKISFKDMLGK